MGTLSNRILLFRVLCALASCPADVQANNTSPWEMVDGWLPQPRSTRGTMDIIWTCLVTIFACSWTVVHPPLTGTVPKSWIFLGAVLTPDLLAVAAFAEYVNVRHHTKAIKQMNKGPWTMSQSFFVAMGGVHLEFNDCKGAQVNLEELRRALRLDLLDLNTIPLEDVRASAKTNHIFNALVCVQASWLVVQVIGRAVAKLPITTLEVVTVGYVLCGLIAYLCWWHKPQDAAVLIKVDCGNLTFEDFYRQIEDVYINGFDSSPQELPLVIVIAGVFGAVNCTAWNFIFPTVIESTIWKVASVLAAFLPMAYFALGRLHWNRWNSLIGFGIAVMSIISYVIVRLYLLVEPFVAFRSVPVGVFYEVSWTSWIPHI